MAIEYFEDGKKRYEIRKIGKATPQDFHEKLGLFEEGDAPDHPSFFLLPLTGGDYQLYGDKDNEGHYSDQIIHIKALPDERHYLVFLGLMQEKTALYYVYPYSRTTLAVESLHGGQPGGLVKGLYAFTPEELD
jgi:hypothetical protein